VTDSPALALLHATRDRLSRLPADLLALATLALPAGLTLDELLQFRLLFHLQAPADENARDLAARRCLGGILAADEAQVEQYAERLLGVLGRLRVPPAAPPGRRFSAAPRRRPPPSMCQPGC